MGEQSEFYKLKDPDSNGEPRYIEDATLSDIMYALCDMHPECSSVYTHDDIGMATLMEDIYQGNILYCPQKQAWYIWDKRWEKQTDAGVISDKLQTLLNLLRIYCDEIADEDYKKYISSIRRFSPMRNILEVLKTRCRLAAADMDTNPYIINTTNGAYDLRTGKPVADISPYNITKMTSTYYPTVLTKRCDRWYQFIDEIMSHDKEKAAFLQRALGYSILGINKSECMFIAYGKTTRNGKGTLMETIARVLSEDYAKSAATELICVDRRGYARDFNAPQPALAQLVGARLVTLSESEQGALLASAAIKAMTGRDTLQTRDLYESSFNFTPQFTLWLSTNYLPGVNDDTVFKSDRMWVIEFNETFVDSSKRDDNLKELFADPENKPTILKWLMDGCLDYMSQGLNPPEVILKSTQNYRERFDKIGNFIRDCCDLDEEKKCLRGTMYTAYCNWCAKPENSCQPYKTTRFFSEMELRGYRIVKNSDFYFRGIDVKNAPGTFKVK